MEPSKRPPIGPGFWNYMIRLPVLVALGFAGLACVLRSPEKPASCEELLVAAAEGFLLAIFSVACLQAPFFRWWHDHVEGDLGMPPLVHRCAGVAELGILALRLWGGGSLAATFSGEHLFLDVQIARRCAAAHVLTSGLMGGAFWTWIWGVCTPLGLLPAAFVSFSSVVSTDNLLRLALVAEASEGERLKWHLAAVGAAVCGAVSAMVLHRLTARLRNNLVKRTD
eukprot:TRINITY_DN56251_c0_g1_i1.p2 TRINITY_DN56251_c0_g1~~TRINITY_DN56251_c0_g1_i1.p2  ORF type:complete len:225 (-),score=46.41 TRINITY_DN56251_c0_g1_i1:270-944(-)